MGARPVSLVGYRLYITGPALAESPDTYDSDSILRGYAHGLRHAGAIIIAVHHRDVCSYEAKNLTVQHQAGAPRSHKSRRRPRGILLAKIAREKNNCRAQNSS